MRLGSYTIATVVLLLCAPAGQAQDPEDPLQALVEQERVRAMVEKAFDDVVDARRRPRA